MDTGSEVIRTPDQRLRVFVSSTLHELEAERGAAAEAIRSLKLTPVLFELGARPHPPRQLYQAYLEQSHVFVGVYGEEYGWVAPGMEISGLEDEYLLSGDRPKLLYVKKHAPGRDPRLEALLRRIEDHDRASYRTFSSPAELAGLISDDLAVLLSERFETAGADPLAGSATARRVARRPAAWAAIALATAAAVTGALYLGRRGDRPATGPPPGAAGLIAGLGIPAAEPASIAVLPFVNMSGDPDQEYFSDGLAQEVLSLLGKRPGLRVISRTSSFQFKGRPEDVRTISRILNVEHVLEGSVRRSGAKIRVTAELVNAASGTAVWSESFDRDLDDVFRVQEEIATSVVRALEPELSGAAFTTSPEPPRDLDAYTLVLQARYLSDRRTRDDSARAVRLLEQALGLDPEYAAAWAELARAEATRAASGFVPAEQGVARARNAAERALALDPDSGPAHALIGWVEMSWEGHWRVAESHLQRALELDPGSVGVLSNAAMLARAFGRLDESIELYGRAIARDPLQGLAYSNLAISLLYAGRLDEAEAAVRKGIALRPRAIAQRYLLGRVLLARGRLEDARAEVEQEPDEGWRLVGEALVDHALGRPAESQAAVRSLTEGFSTDMPYQIAQVHAFRGEIDLAFDWLERAHAAHDTGLAEMIGDPLLLGLERDPRYAAFLERIGLAG
ncbi:MAG TPA: DUF4062 domain-containing protein [Thermoanaerobaculia bacterium]|nr:DUF4062 domain-containing protein [Thermoanaerobaculia bacterium]